MDLNCEFPTDRGKFPDIIKNSNLKRQIISFGPCKPNIKFPHSTTYFEDGKTAKAENFLSNIILLQICLAKKYPEAGSVILLYLTKYIVNRVGCLRIENILISNQIG